MKENVGEAWRQYNDGAITYVEFVHYAIANITEEDYAEYCVYVPKNWPFQPIERRS